MSRTLSLLFGLTFFVALASIPALAGGHIGAGVTWVPYEDREDFLKKSGQFDKVFIGTDSVESVFQIPPNNYFKASAKSKFRKHEDDDSFESYLIQAVDALVRDATPELKPFLAIGISSHGSETGQIARQFGYCIYHTDLLNVIFEQVDRFQRQTGKTLDLEIIYNACYSGTIIDSLKAVLEKRRTLGAPTGAVTIVTSTTREKLTYGSLSIGSYLLQALYTMADGAKHAASKSFEWSEAPTLARYGFFGDLGATWEEHPQIFSNTYSWTPKATLDFLSWQYRNFLRSYADQRSILLDFDLLLERSTDVASAIDVVDFMVHVKNPKNREAELAEALKHPQKIARRAAALLLTNSMSHETREVRKKQGPLIRDIFFEWLEDKDSVRSFLKTNRNYYLINALIFLPTDYKNWKQSLEKIQLVATLASELQPESTQSPEGSRAYVDKIREILSDIFFIKRPEYGHHWERRKKQDQKNPPREIMEAFVRAHIAKKAAWEVSDEKSLLKLTAGPCATLLGNAPKTLEEAFWEAIDNYDSGIPFFSASLF